MRRPDVENSQIRLANSVFFDLNERWTVHDNDSHCVCVAIHCILFTCVVLVIPFQRCTKDARIT